MGPCVASVQSDGALIAAISGGGETMSVIPVSNATNLNGVPAGMVGWQQVGTDTAETSSTTTVINATTHAARVGDILNFTAGTAGNIGVWSVVSAVTANTITLTNALPATPANGDAFSIMRPQPFYLQREDESSFSGALGVLGIGYTNEGQGTLNSVDGDWGSPAYTRRGNTPATIVYDPGIGGAAAEANQAVRSEDIAFPAAGALVMSGAVNNRNFSAFNSTNGDALPIMAGDKGVVGIMPMYDSSISGGSSPLTLEDQALANGQAIYLVGTQAQDPITADVVSGDATYAKTDTGGRTITTYAPAGEMFSSCSSAITGVSRTAIKTAVASNRIYVTSITCSNNSAVASQASFSDGAGTQLAAANIGTLASGGTFAASFPTPLRGSVNTDFSVTMTTTSTSTICCANGFISTI